MIESARRGWLVTTPLVRHEAHEVLDRKFGHVPNARDLFDAIWVEAACVPDVPEPADDNDARLVRAACNAGAVVFVTGDQRVLGWSELDGMHILNPRLAWLKLFSETGLN